MHDKVEPVVCNSFMTCISDDFVTPSSTPPNESVDGDSETLKDEAPSMADIFAEELSESALHEKIYDK